MDVMVRRWSRWMFVPAILGLIALCPSIQGAETAGTSAGQGSGGKVRTQRATPYRPQWGPSLCGGTTRSAGTSSAVFGGTGRYVKSNRPTVRKWIPTNSGRKTAFPSAWQGDSKGKPAVPGRQVPAADGFLNPQERTDGEQTAPADGVIFRR